MKRRSATTAREICFIDGTSRMFAYSSVAIFSIRDAFKGLNTSVCTASVNSTRLVSYAMFDNLISLNNKPEGSKKDSLQEVKGQ